MLYKKASTIKEDYIHDNEEINLYHSDIKFNMKPESQAGIGARLHC